MHLSPCPFCEGPPCPIVVRALNAGAPLALWVVGHTMPPVALTVDGL